MLIKLEDITKTYKLDGIEIKALSNVSLAIEKKEFISIIGASGSGKSTLMHIIGLLDTPSSGKYYLEDLEATKLSDQEFAKIRNRKIGFIFQAFNLLPKTPAIENVKLPAFYSKDKSKLNERAEELLIKVGLADRLQNKPSQLSGGQQQRVAIARALMNDPDIILADEPTGNLDSKSGKDILNLLSKLNEEGKTIVIVTHDPDVAGHTRRTLKLSDGKVVEDKKL